MVSRLFVCQSFRSTSEKYGALPLSLGDGAFSNPAVLDAADENRVQTMECVDSIAVWMRYGMS
jgi:hypothetical protein